MKKYSVPHSLNINNISGKEVSVVPALAGAVGALAGMAAAGAAFEGGKAAGRKIFGNDRYMRKIENISNLKVIVTN